MSQPSTLHEYNGSATTLIIFGGIRNGVGMPTFEFTRSLASLDVNKLFVMDTAQAWYQKGIPEYPSALQLGEYLALATIKSRAILIGNSMGGFAALLFSAFIPGSQALAFAPQTFIGAELRARHSDNRWSKHITPLHKELGTERPYYDLRPVLLNANNRARIVYGDKDRLDTVHAEHMAGIPGVTLHPVPGAGHGVVKEWRDSGKLIETLKEMIEQ